MELTKTWNIIEARLDILKNNFNRQMEWTTFYNLTFITNEGIRGKTTVVNILKLFSIVLLVSKFFVLF